MKNKLLIGLMALVSAGSFASGFKCEGDQYSVKLFNKTVDGTRIPAVMVVSEKEHGTLFRASGSEIRKVNRINSVQYIVNMDEDKYILQVAFKEGKETLEEGESVDGQLIMILEDGDSKVVEPLECVRYLKN